MLNISVVERGCVHGGCQYEVNDRIGQLVNIRLMCLGSRRCRSRSVAIACMASELSGALVSCTYNPGNNRGPLACLVHKMETTKAPCWNTASISLVFIMCTMLAIASIYYDSIRFKQ